MSGVNRCQIIGNLGKDVELRYSANGKANASFSVAVNEGFGVNQRVEWFSVVTWEKLAERCSQYLTKGQQVYVEGRMQTRKWDGKDGQTHYRTELVANNVQFLGKREAGEGDIDIEDLPFEGDD